MFARTGFATVLFLTLTSTGAAAQALAQAGQGNTRGERNSLLDRPALTEVRDTPLSRALAELQHRSGVRLAFSPSLLANAGRVTCICKELTVGQALDQMLAHTSFKFAELAGQVLVERKPTREPRDDESAIAGMPAPAVAPLASNSSEKASRNWSLAPRLVSLAKPLDVSMIRPVVAGTVRGRVVEAGSRRPLSGVQVFIPNTGRGALTDAAGNFFMVGLPAGTHNLRAEIIGFAANEQNVIVRDEQTTEIDFALTAAAIQIDEIVITGTAGAVS